MGQLNHKATFTYSKPVPNSSCPSHSSIFTHPNAMAYFSTELPSKAETLFDLFRSSVDCFPSHNCLGQVSRSSPSTYTWDSYTKVWSTALKIGFGLDFLRSSQGLSQSRSFLGIYSANRAEWLVMDLACISQNITTVAMYDVQQLDTIEMVIREAGLRFLACSKRVLGNVALLAEEGRVGELKNVICFEKVSEEERGRFEAQGLHLASVKEIAEMIETGQTHPPRPEDWYTVCYTSGTTGRPKGAIISHHNIVAMLAGVIQSNIHIEPQDVHLSYLPLAHLMERSTCYLVLNSGAAIGFYRGDLAHLFDDMKLLKPTIFVSVPRLYNRIYEMIARAISETTGLKKALLNKALSAKQHNYERKGKCTHKIYDKLVFKRFGKMLGGKVRVMMTGSAPIAEEVVKMMRVVFSCIVVEGFGQTETCAASFMTNPADSSTGHVGGPILTVEAKLVDVAEMGYFVSHLDELGNPAPEGEICIRGPVVFQGYLNDPDTTQEIIDGDGWLHTGDIGTVLSHNSAFKIIDRKKNCFKLAQGEFVAPEKIETAYSTSPFVAQIFVYGHSLESFLVAVVVPDEAYVQGVWAVSKNLPTDFEANCHNPDLLSDLLSDLAQRAKECKLLGFELVKRIHIEPSPWTSADLLTPTHKLMRHKARLKYHSVLSHLYSAN
jgi:long-chain acyl-CoA synthetase